MQRQADTAGEAQEKSKQIQALMEELKELETREIGMDITKRQACWPFLCNP